MNMDYPAHRVKMVDSQLRTTDVTRTAILEAMGAVPRELFVPAALRGLAYSDDDVRIAPARDGVAPRYLMQASPFGKLLQLAEIGLSDSVLDIGCGTGYSAAVLSRLAKSVVALESDPVLAAEAVAALKSVGSENVSVVTGALTGGHVPGAPYDVIVVGGAVERVPDGVFDQLAEGGRLVVVEGRGNAAWARLYLKQDGAVSGRSAFNAAIKPLPGFDLARAFEF